VRSLKPVAAVNCSLLGRQLRPVVQSANRAIAAAITINEFLAMPPLHIRSRIVA
jgi:hypothetical protein